MSARCPACSSEVAPDAVRCSSCGRALGEQNRCPHCQAYAPIMRVGGAYRCAACSKPRTRGPGMVVIDSPSGLGRIVGRAVPVGFAALGLGLGAALLLIAAPFLFFGGTTATAIAAALAVVGVGVGASSVLAASRVRAHSRKKEDQAAEQRLLEIVGGTEGGVTATQAARALGAGEAKTERMLEALAVQDRVRMEVTEEGQVLYAGPGALVSAPLLDVKVRVAGPGEPDRAAGSGEEAAEEVEAPAERRARKEDR